MPISLIIVSLTELPESTFLTAMTTWAPRSARTRAVSLPIPLEAPHMGQHSILITDCADSIEPVGINDAFTVGNDKPVGNFVR